MLLARILNCLRLSLLYLRYLSFFTDQFNEIGLTGELDLDRGIDGISGATLSVRALKKLARLALYLHTRIPSGDDTP